MKTLKQESDEYALKVCPAPLSACHTEVLVEIRAQRDATRIAFMAGAAAAVERAAGLINGTQFPHEIRKRIVALLPGV